MLNTATRIRLGFCGVCISVLATGCFGGQYAFPNSDDFRISHQEQAQRQGELAEYGDVYALGMQSAHEVNGWVGEAVDASARVFDVLEDIPPTSKRGGWDIYGPYRDAQTGLDWRFRMNGDAEGSTYEVQVRNGGDFANLLTGNIDIDGPRRMGQFTVDFDVVEQFELKRGPDRDRTYTGTVDIRFERDVDTEHKVVDIDYADFEVTQEFPIREYFAADGYEFRRNADGAGLFHLDITSTFQSTVWSGPERERMTLDLEWNADGAGRGVAEVTHLEGEGDLSYGDIKLEECFDESGYYTWRHLNDPYAGAFGAYNDGDSEACPVVDAELPEFTQ